MAIENRNLEAGARLEAKYKGADYICVVEREPDGKRVYLLKGGGHAPMRFSSISGAARFITGSSKNGWGFFSLVGEAKPSARRKEAEPKAEKTPRPSRQERKPEAKARPGKAITQAPSTVLIARSKGRMLRGQVHGEGPDSRLVILDAGDSGVEPGSQFPSLSAAAYALTGRWRGAQFWSVEALGPAKAKAEPDGESSAKTRGGVTVKAERQADEAAAVRRADVKAKAKLAREAKKAAQAAKAAA